MKSKLMKRKGKDKCGTASCRDCHRCALVNYEEPRPEWKNNASQLYATEAEHYFFYFPQVHERTIK
jgi:hypothetical protein